MAERGQRTELIIGGVKAEVALVKSSAKPREARHDVKWPDDPLAEKHERERVDLAAVHEAEQAALGEREAHHAGDVPAPQPADADPFAGSAPTLDEPEPASVFEEDDEPAKPMQGVRLDDGSFVDLTEELAEIDRRTKLEGMEVIATIPQQSVPRERVRDAHWVASMDPRSAEALGYLGAALRSSGKAAVVRWTKRTNQALGILVMRKHGRKWALSLLELEWAQNMREPSERVTGPHEFQLRDEGVAAAERLVEAFSEAPEKLDRLEDERLAKRAELLLAARAEGKKPEGFELPPEPAGESEFDGVLEQWAAAAAAR